MVLGKDFWKVLSAGRRRAFFLGFRRRNSFVLTLEELTSVVRPSTESYLGVKTIPVSRIIGTENRADDFTVAFLPLKKNMHERWTVVRDLLLGDGIPDSISVVEYGGFYFVRDGNHRISVAKTHRIDFMDAAITRYATPVSLPPNMSRRKIALFKAKAEFQQRTQFFDYVPEQSMGEAHPETWETLENRIIPEYSARFAERVGRTPEPGEVERFFADGALGATMDTVESQALPALFPGRYVLDIACELLAAHQNGYGDLTPGEALVAYVDERKRRRPARRILLKLVQRVRRLTMSAQDERDVFLRMTRLRRFCPDARIAEGRKDWYRFLTRQVVVTYSGYHAHETGHQALIDELVTSWYEDLYKPAVELHKEYGIEWPFPVFYMRWMSYRRKRLLQTVRKSGYAPRIGLRRSLEAYLHQLGRPVARAN